MRLSRFIVVLLVAFAGAPAFAEVINTAEVMVDVTADNASEARTLAFSQGEKEAFKQVIEKMAPDRAEGIINQTPASRISALVLKNEMIEEKMSGNRYRATMRYTFFAQGLSRIIGGEPAPAPVATKAPVSQAFIREDALLILPVWNDNAVFRLWDKENIWRPIVNSVILQHGEGVLIAPYGDKRDTEDTDGLRALKSDFALLEPLATKYGTKQVGLMLASVDPNDPKQALKVTLKTIRAGGTDSRIFSYPLRLNETLNMQMQRAAQDVLLKLRQERRGESGALDEQINTLNVRMQSVNMKQWEMIRAKLLKIPAMMKVELVKVSYFDTTLNLTYRGTPELLGKMLAAAGFRLFKDENTLVLALP